MTDTLVKIVLSIFAAIIVMIIHEITKTVVYAIYMRKDSSDTNKGDYLKFWRFIDPIGLILAIIQCAVFSKQYPFLIKSKKAAIIIGITGYISMIVLLVSSCLTFRHFANLDVEGNTTAYLITYQYIGYFLQYIAYYSCMMLLVNFFPLTSFDISLILAGSAPGAFLRIRKYDAVLKLIFMIIVILQIFSTVSALLTVGILL